VRWFSETLDRTETSRTIVGVGLFNLGLGVHDKGTARDDRLMQRTTGIEQAHKGWSCARIVTLDAPRCRRA
jgi:hypothetical protein